MKGGIYMNPEIFGWEQMVYSVIMIILTIFGVILSNKYVKTEKSKIIVLKVLASILLFTIVTNRISICLKNDPVKWTYLIPDSFCGMSSLVLALAVLVGKKDNPVLHFVWFISLLGGVITFVYPDFIGQNPSIFYIPTISGLLHHSISIIVNIFMFMYGYIKVTYKKWYCTLFGFTCYLTVGAFLISVFGYSDAFHINSPLLSGTPLTAWFIAPIYAVVYGITLYVFYIVNKKNVNNKKNSLEKSSK